MAARRSSLKDTDPQTASKFDRLVLLVENLVKVATNPVAAAAGFASRNTGVNSFATAAAAANKVTDAITASFDKLVGHLSSAIGGIAKYVEKINPGLVQQAFMALDDLMAVIGDMLSPILQVITQLVRQFADVLETMRPALDPIINVIVQLVKIFGELIEPIAQMLTPILGVLAQILEEIVVPIVKIVADVFKYMAKVIKEVINFIIDALNKLPFVNIKKLNYDDFEKKDSRGKAIRSVNRMSAEQLGEATRQSAFGQTTNYLKEIMDNTRRTADGITGGLAGYAAKQAAAQQETAEHAARANGKTLTAGSRGLGDF